MSKLLVNAPTGQQLLEIEPSGGYFDAARVLWDERQDGPLPAVTVGGMKRVGNALVFDQTLQDEHDAAKAAEDAEETRRAVIDSAIASDSTVAQLKAMTNAEFSAWFTANVTTLAQARNVLERLARVIIRRVL